MSVGADFGEFQLGPRFAYGDEDGYAVDFECGVLGGGSTVQSCVNKFLEVSKGESVSATLTFKNGDSGETLLSETLASHLYPEPPRTPNVGLIVGLTLGGVALACGACVLALFLVKKGKCQKCQKCGKKTGK